MAHRDDNFNSDSENSNDEQNAPHTNAHGKSIIGIVNLPEGRVRFDFDIIKTFRYKAFALPILVLCTTNFLPLFRRPINDFIDALPFILIFLGIIVTFILFFSKSFYIFDPKTRQVVLYIKILFWERIFSRIHLSDCFAISIDTRLYLPFSRYIINFYKHYEHSIVLLSKKAKKIRISNWWLDDFNEICLKLNEVSEILNVAVLEVKENQRLIFEKDNSGNIILRKRS